MIRIRRPFYSAMLSEKLLIADIVDTNRTREDTKKSQFTENPFNYILSSVVIL